MDVLFTHIEGTLAAVRVARSLARELGGRVTVVHLRPLDFGASLDVAGHLVIFVDEAARG